MSGRACRFTRGSDFRRLSNAVPATGQLLQERKPLAGQKTPFGGLASRR